LQLPVAHLAEFAAASSGFSPRREQPPDAFNSLRHIEACRRSVGDRCTSVWLLTARGWKSRHGGVRTDIEPGRHGADSDRSRGYGTTRRESRKAACTQLTARSPILGAVRHSSIKPLHVVHRTILKYPVRGRPDIVDASPERRSMRAGAGVSARTTDHAHLHGATRPPGSAADRETGETDRAQPSLHT